MVNTVTQKTLYGFAKSKNIVRSIHVVSDGTEETATVIYNNSDFIANTAIVMIRDNQLVLISANAAAVFCNDVFAVAVIPLV